MDHVSRNLEAAFETNFESRNEHYAAVEVHQKGTVLASLARMENAEVAEPPPTLVWSCTKAPAATCLLVGLEEHSLDLGTLVADVWPEFGQNGKNRVTFGQLLSHQAGLAALSEDARKLDWTNHEAIAAALAAQEPNWKPGRAHGYHAKTYGYLLDEALRRLTGGIPLGEFWRDRIADPLDLQAWIGMPEDEQDRLVDIIAPRVQPGAVPKREEAFYQALAREGSLTKAAFTAPVMPPPGRMNRPEHRRVANGSLGGYATARGLCEFYEHLLQGEIVSENLLRTLEEPMTTGEDLVLKIPTAFTAGFMKDPLENGQKLREIFGPSPAAFGQPGAGGSLAFADPEHGIAFAYIMDRMELGVLPNERGLSLVEALYK